MQLFVVVVFVLATAVSTVKIQPRIVGGKDAKPTDFKYQVKIHAKEKQDSRKYLTCGGSVISEKWILTGAHCFENRTVTEVNLGMNNEFSYTKTVTATKVIIHESYVHEEFKVINDIALVEIPAIQYGDFIQKIKLSDQTKEPAAGDIVTVAGWGQMEGDARPKKIQYATFKVLDNNECKKIAGKSVGDNSFCTLELTKCCGQGDSGGPAVMGSGATAKQVGIVSYGVNNLTANTPTVYVRVASYWPWIKSKTNL